MATGAEQREGQLLLEDKNLPPIRQEQRSAKATPTPFYIDGVEERPSVAKKELSKEEINRKL